MLLSPAGPGMVVILPATLAWVASAAPFCALGDLVSRIAGQEEVRIL
jgi:hypothetical protein